MPKTYFNHDRGDLYRLQGLDLSLLGAASLYLAGSPATTVSALPLAMLPDEWLGSGTFRNSFYIEPWSRLSAVRDLWLLIEAQGSMRVRVMRACPGRQAEVLREFRIDNTERAAQAHWIGEPGEMLAGSRLFWHIDAIDGAVLHDAAWCTRTRPRDGMRLAVLMRTFKRAGELRALLQRFADSAAQDGFHAQLLNQIDFMVLDSTDGAAADWAGVEQLGLNLELIAAPNLGGGGNASHLAQLFLEAQDDGSALRADEVLILDDDLTMSMESLARYWMWCAYRSQEVVCSLPVLMKSRPTRVWEDGGFWGRRGFDDRGDGVRSRSLAPHLVRHGVALDDFAHLDAFGPLNECEYTTFIFFGLSQAALRRIGLPAAFFLRGDDVELSMRAGAAGLSVITNPNLAAWHEPAHSHAQEYMAILHGMIINLAYTDDRADSYAAWFEQRMVEHATLGDADGLRVYQQVLDDLLDADSAVLTPTFESHYPARLGAWPQNQRTPVTEEARERLRQDPGTCLLPFLYPGLHPHGLRTGQRVLLLDAAGSSYRTLPSTSTAQRVALMQAFGLRLQRFNAEFDGMQARWRERLQHSGSTAFWAEVRERHHHGTRRLLQHRRVRRDPIPAPTEAKVLPPSAPIRELRQRLERELVSISQMRKHVNEQPASHVTGDTGQRPARWWRKLWKGQHSADRFATPDLSDLPPDFDPQLYLSLHADVARTGVDPVRHYLQFGRQEGRRFRLE